MLGFEVATISNTQSASTGSEGAKSVGYKHFRISLYQTLSYTNTDRQECYVRTKREATRALGEFLFDQPLLCLRETEHDSNA